MTDDLLALVEQRVQVCKAATLYCQGVLSTSRDNRALFTDLLNQVAQANRMQRALDRGVMQALADLLSED